ncbi:MAG TPA: hypothetical protein VK629_02355 [Steroidobacteraceae bacterium]|nr:hypothetical protein [Steroidobacteraceae bacterium]
MPIWFIPALKAILPHVGTIVSFAAPVFTRKSAEATANQIQLLQQQIAELQAAVSANDTHIKSLAKQLGAAIAALESDAVAAESKLRRPVRVSFAALAIASAALGIALISAFVR